ncbi:MAG: hypothetical protein GXO79_09700 [Chlorobi bacterium]|nr:hypothetical protein [Chlorobiota bacterium]
MKLRLIISIVFLLLSFFLIRYSFHADENLTLSDIYMNLGSEIIGIVLTVVIVDWLFERKRTKEETRKIALSGLNKINYAVWVWQGCPRDANINTVYYFLSITNNEDLLTVFTQNIMIQLAHSSEETLTLNNESVNSNKFLKNALVELSTLSKIRETDDILPPVVIAQKLQNATLSFMKVLQIPFTKKTDKEIDEIRDTSFEKQSWRRYGE